VSDYRTQLARPSRAHNREPVQLDVAELFIETDEFLVGSSMVAITSIGPRQWARHCSKAPGLRSRQCFLLRAVLAVRRSPVPSQRPRRDRERSPR
jgi:hypothetical protein